MSKRKRSLWIQTKKTRGEVFYQKIPKIGAIFYEKLMDSEMIRIQIEEITKEILSKVKTGKILDVGIGPGRLLQRIHKLNPKLKLYGLDLSKSMYNRAKKNLEGLEIELLHCNITKTEFDSNYFDLVTCTGSFYLWDQPIRGLNEIHRILKNNSSALLFETYTDYNEVMFKKSLQENLKKIKPHKRPVAKRLLNKQLKITYTLSEVEEILSKSTFSKNYSIEKTVLSNLPIWLKISLIKI
ncbi:MAG: class I SAM-dependent methyltransferase [Candidatus Heimdallarchaeota archaeon]|nr:class I SAM-dependent methyltransferase [Candidatus Heimdallarchaeota archaeon]MCK4878857.1 class I SAM-dependent methyltransferase [Candidatus Heimdallarchaeota archaeon]